MLNGRASDPQVHYSFALFNTRAKTTPKVKVMRIEGKEIERIIAQIHCKESTRRGCYKNHDRSINSIQTRAFSVFNL